MVNVEISAEMSVIGVLVEILLIPITKEFR